MATGDRVPPTDDANVDQTLTSPPIQPVSNPLFRATEFLFENSRIAPLRTHYDKYRRYVQLNKQNMFNSLVLLYSGLFLSQWQHFRRFMDQFPPPAGVQPYTYAARVYISMWFIDLYVSNRDAVRKLSTLAFNEKYGTELLHVSHEYDSYLTLLNGSIRPTHIKLFLEDVLYMPVLADTLDLEAAYNNFFDITGFDANEDLFYGLIQIMKDRKQWNISTLSTNTLGRPCWLFDWHTDNRVCAWFHMEGNFNLEDVTLAYIIGVACTPKLGPRDVDDWQYFPNATVPAEPNVANYVRVNPRRFFGSYEVSTLDTETDYLLPTTFIEAEKSARKPKRAKKGTAQTSTSAAGKQPQATGSEPSDGDPPPAATVTVVDIPAPRFRIVDWTYYYLVVRIMDAHTRTGALRTISLL